MMSYRSSERVALASVGSLPFAIDAAPALAADEPVTLARLVLDLTPRRQRGRWAMQLDRAVAAAPDRLVVVAHGLACAAFSFWAQLTPHRYRRNITGALLIEPVKPAATRAFSFMRSPNVPLPFPSLVLSLGQVGPDQMQRYLADRWGSGLETAATFSDRAWPWLTAATQLSLVAIDQ